MKTKLNGALLHVSSLPSLRGIGSLGRGAFSFVDFLAEAGVDFWQMLPIGQTSYGDSPYQSPSAFAGNPYFVDVDILAEEGLLTYDELPVCACGNVDYKWLFNTRYDLLRQAYGRFKPDNAYQSFVVANSEWLLDYALFSSLKAEFGFKPFTEWPEKFRYKDKLAAEDIAARIDDVDFYLFIQYQFDKQMRALKDYAAGKGVKLIGDIPIYVAYDSADVWANPILFKLDKKLKPTEVAGVPPDYFSATGQLWGNPLYNWPRHKADGYEWWHKRLQRQTTYFDKVRIDHFRGFESYYKIPYGSKDATVGKWTKGVGLSVFEGFEGGTEGKIIAEDLGIITDDVRRLVKRSGYPGMKVFQFAFDGKSENEHLPNNVKSNSVYYTGTHDNDTLCGWWSDIGDNTRALVKSAVNYKDGDIIDAVLACVMKSEADLVVVPMQDYLREGSAARMNTPGITEGNWLYVLPMDYETQIKSIKKYTELRSDDCRII